MNRQLGVERLYSLGDFKNIKFSNVLNDIPSELATNERLMSLLYYSMVISCELGYRKYYEMVEKLTRDKVVDVIGALEQEREQTYAEFLAELKKLEIKQPEENVAKES